MEFAQNKKTQCKGKKKGFVWNSFWIFESRFKGSWNSKYKKNKK